MTMQSAALYYHRHRQAIHCAWVFVGCFTFLMGVYMYRPWKYAKQQYIPSDTRPSLIRAENNSPEVNKQWSAISKQNKLIEIVTQKKRQQHVTDVNKYVNTTQKQNVHTEIMDKPSGKFIQIFDDDITNLTATCIDYKMMNPVTGETKLCLHQGQDDNFVSGSFLKGGYWEQSNLQSMGVVLKQHPDMVFLDVGCHMGMYAMYANKAGNQVVAIDPLKKNLRLLKKSVQLVKQENNVVILLNAVSNKHEKLFLEEGQQNNIGSTHLVAADKPVNKARQAADYRIQTILMDDLLEVLNLDHKEVMIKMDVEGYEWKALQGAHELFKRANVCFVMMEFASHITRPSGLEIIDFMKSYNMYPYSDLYLTKRLPLDDRTKYSIDVVFAKETKECKKH